MLAFLRALPLLWQLGLLAGGGIALGGGYAYWHHKVYSSGYVAAIADVEAANAESVNAADKAREIVRECFDRGGNWDTVKRLCVVAGQ